MRGSLSDPDGSIRVFAMPLPAPLKSPDFDHRNGPILHWYSLEAQPGRISYVKRFRMERELSDLPRPFLPPGYSFVPWSRQLLEAHAEILFASFQGEIDSAVFPSLASPLGCQFLMNEITSKSGFIPQATWLLVQGGELCGTVQGLRDRSGPGAIQNLGIKPSNRGLGLGEALLVQALHGFQNATLGRAMLEVTAQNDVAVRLYRRLGFIRRKILYKTVQAAPEGIK